MTDRQEPEPLDRPTAGRPPEPQPDNEPTRPLRLPPAGDRDNEPTRPLRPPAAADDEGPTKRLWSDDWFGDEKAGPGTSGSHAPDSSAPARGTTDDDAAVDDAADPLETFDGAHGGVAVGDSDAVREKAEGETAATEAEAEPKDAAEAEPKADEGESTPVKKKLTSAGAIIWVLLALFGYTLVAQLRSNNDDQGLATARQEDLVSILSDLESRDSRLQSEISGLEQSQRQLTSGVSSREAALSEAEKQANQLGLLAGTLPGKGPGLKIVVDKVKASAVLNAVEELRGAGGEVMELAGDNGGTVRIVASSYFVDAAGGGIDVDGVRLTGPYTLWVIGQPQTMQTALQIPGGVVASVQSGGGSVTMEAQNLVQVTAVRKATTLQYAKPVS